MSATDDAIEKVITTINDNPDAGFRHDEVAAHWPELAGALAGLMDIYGRKPPASWRVARKETRTHG